MSPRTISTLFSLNILTFRGKIKGSISLKSIEGVLIIIPPFRNKSPIRWKSILRNCDTVLLNCVYKLDYSLFMTYNSYFIHLPPKNNFNLSKLIIIKHPKKVYAHNWPKVCNFLTELVFWENKHLREIASQAFKSFHNVGKKNNIKFS